jgi:SAM-dependent methyltransferase
MAYLTPDAKTKLSSTIRELRDRLLTDIHNGAESFYRLSVTLKQAGLAEEAHIKRQRLEKWLDEQVRSEGKIPTDKDFESIKARYRLQAEKLAAATFLNRLVVIKQLEAMGLSKPLLVTGGWNSPAYREFREFAPDLLKDETEGMGLLLSLLYDELALDLPGLFGRGGITDLFPIPASTLRVTIEALDQLELRDIWLDDTVLGWVYQFWNDPEREDLDTKLNQGGKVEPHEIASKTQMFTERYMVEWLLHNSLGQLWLGICRANDWQAEVISSGTLARLEERRSQWREWRKSGKVALDGLMPMETELEERWKYFVPTVSDQVPLSKGDLGGLNLNESQEKSEQVSFSKGDLGGLNLNESQEKSEQNSFNKAEESPLAPLDKGGSLLSIRDLKILDPACGSGHFLVIAVGLLFALYQEEARHRQQNWTDEFIIKSILENNLYGLDIDPRAVQIAAAALWLKAKSFCPKFSLKSLNLVASNLNLAALAKDDPDLVALRRGVYEATGIPENLTEQIIQSLRGADQWGSLLKVDEAVDRAISDFEADQLRIKTEAVQGDIFKGFAPAQTVIDFDAKRVKSSLLEMVESFLAKHTGGDDLGLRLRGQQLAAGVRFIRMIRENSYDLVIGNPPYQGSSKMADSKYLEKHYPKGKADLYAAFLERGLQLAKAGGLSALLTMRNWMFISQFSDIRQYLISWVKFPAACSGF